MHKTGISIFAVCAFLGSAMAHAHGGHDPLFSQAWLSWEHGLAHVLAHAWAVPVLATGLALAGGWLLFRLRGGWVGLFVRRVRVSWHSVKPRRWLKCHEQAPSPTRGEGLNRVP